MSPSGIGADPRTTPGAVQVKVTAITVDVLRVRVPQGAFSDSEKVWNHVDTSFLPGETIRVLHRNGLRVAKGAASAWPPIKAILETQAGVETSQTRLTMNNGLPLILQADTLPQDQLLFVYRRDGTLAGAPWRLSRNLLRIDYGLSPAAPDTLRMDVVPAIRLDSPAAQELRGPERWDPRAAVVDRSLPIRDLAFPVELASGEFVAVGPSSTTRELPYVMGSLLLCEERDGRKLETMYFITPTLTRTAP